MELPTVFAVVGEGEQRPEALLDAAMQHWLHRVQSCEPAVEQTVRAQLELLLRLYAAQETKTEVTSTLRLSSARIKFIIQSAQ